MNSLEARLFQIQQEKDNYPYSSEPQVGQFLHSLILLTTPKKIQEFGTFKGATTLYLIEAAQKVKASVETYDVVDHRSVVLREPEMLGLYKFEERSSLDVLGKEPVDFVFLDTLHTYEHTKQELVLIREQMKGHSVVVLHDVCSFPGVHEAIKHVMSPRYFDTLILPTPCLPERPAQMSGIAVITTKK